MSVLPPSDAVFPRTRRGFLYPSDDVIFPFGSVVTLAEIDPVTGSILVPGNYPITARILCPGGLDPALVSIVVNGITCTVANGRLDYWQTRSLVGTTIVPDYSDVYFATLVRWFDSSGESVTATVVYNGLTIGSTTFTVRESEGDGSKVVYWTAWAIAIDDTNGQANLEFVVYENYIDPSYGVEFNVQDSMAHVGGDVRYHIGTRYRIVQTASGIVAYVVVNRTDASGEVRGWRLDRQAGSGVVQGWKRNRQGASGIVGIRFVYHATASGVVGIRYLKHTHGSGVVYGVNRKNVLDVHVVDDATYAALVAEGVVFS